MVCDFSEPNDDLFNHTEFEKRIIPFGEDSNKQLNVDDVISDIPFKFLLPKPPSSSPPINETKPAVIEESSKDDSNANVVTSAAVTKSTSSNTDDFIMVDVVVSRRSVDESFISRRRRPTKLADGRGFLIVAKVPRFAVIIGPGTSIFSRCRSTE